MKKRLIHYVFNFMTNSQGKMETDTHWVHELTDKKLAEVLYSALKQDLSTKQFDAFVQHFKEEIIIKDY